MRVAIISDIHSNLTALQAVLQDCRDCDRVWCLGDVVGYGPEPSACIAAVRSVAEVCIAGNHDLAAIGRLPLVQFNDLAAEAAEWTSRQLSAADREFLDQRPLIEERGELTLTHGSPRNPIWEYLTSEWEARENFAYFVGAACFVGHSHVPVAFSIDDSGVPGPQVAVERPVLGAEMPFGKRRHIVNVGSVGQPRDGDSRASYVVVDTERRAYWRKRVTYDIRNTQNLMRAARLPSPLWTRLAKGH
jgi:diadenosine tetraphosphatase ApaH/serine/threonine PP2A family protein phosphatase